MKITTLRIAGIISLVLFLGMLVQLFGPSPAIIVSPQTTFITSPLAADGLPDYSKHWLDQQRVGVTPENNGAIPFLEAMWPAELEPEQQAIVCLEVGMNVPLDDGLDEPWHDTERSDSVQRAVTLMLLAKRGLTPDEPLQTKQAYQDWKYSVIAGGDREEPDAANDDSPSFEDLLAGLESDANYLFTDTDLVGEELVYQCSEYPWTADQLPPLAAWVKRNERNFALLHKAAGRERFYLPPPGMIDDPNDNLLASFYNPSLSSFRASTRALSYRSMLRLGSGDHAGAWTDCLGMRQLASKMPNTTMIDQLVAIACLGIADNSAKQILDTEELPVEVARQMHAHYAAHTPRREMHLAIDQGERLLCLSSLLLVAGERQGLDDEEFLEEAATLARLSLDWNVVLEDLNGWYDRLASAMKITDYAKRTAELAVIEKDIMSLNAGSSEFVSGFLSRSSRAEFMTNSIAALLLPAVKPVSAAEDRHNAQLQLMQVATALAVYRCENGDYPESLDALVPELLPTEPVDLFLGKPLVYTKTDRGYLLVNRGPNGVDNGGMNAETTVYKGYALGWDAQDTKEDQIRELLGEPLTEEEQEKAAEADRLGYTDEPVTLNAKIDPLGDDISLRLPLISADWSVLEKTGDDSK